MSALIDYLKAKNEETRAWIAEAPGRMACTAVEDEAYWAEMGITTVAQYERCMLEAAYYDIYKDIHGIKPRWIDFSKISDDELNRMMQSLDEDSEREQQWEREREEAARAQEEATRAERRERGRIYAAQSNIMMQAFANAR